MRRDSDNQNLALRSAVHQAERETLDAKGAGFLIRRRTALGMTQCQLSGCLN